MRARITELETGNITVTDSVIQPVIERFRLQGYCELLRTLQEGGHLLSDRNGDRYAVLDIMPKERLAFWADLGLMRRDRQGSLTAGKYFDGVLSRAYVFNGHVTSIVLEGNYA